MKKLPLLHLTPRARRDIDECMRFIERFPRGKPDSAAAGTARSRTTTQAIIDGLRPV